MNKMRLFTSIAALGLVLSLGACNSENTDTDNLESDSTEIEYAENPGQLMQKVVDEGNYSVQIACNYWISNGTISYDDYLAVIGGYASSRQMSTYEALFSDTSTLSSVLVDLYVEDSYLLAYEYELSTTGSYDLSKIILLYNDTPYSFGFYQYSASVDAWAATFYYGDWEGYYFSLFDCYIYDLDSVFLSTGADTYNGISCTTFSVNPTAGYFGFDYYLLNMLGSSWCTHQFSLLDYYYDTTYFFAATQEMITSYFYGGLLSSDTTNYYYYLEDDLVFNLYDVGTTDQSEVVDYIYQNV